MSRLDELLVRWHEDGLSAEEVAELEQLLESPEGRRRLVEEFCYIETVSSALRELPAPALSRSRLQLPSWRWWAGVAALLLVAITLAWWWRPAAPLVAPPIHNAEQPNQVIAGGVVLDGAPTLAIADGSAIRVPEEVPAVIRLGDGSQAELEPGTQAVLHGSVPGLRQLVELVEGAGSFRVEKGDGQFQVETGLGRVTALGTEFRVRILSGRRLEVAVREGLVEVDQGGRAQLLSAGDSRVFAAPTRPPARETRAIFTAGDSQTITISRPREGSTTLSLADDARIVIDGKPSRLAELPPGTIVFLEQAEGRVIAVRADGQSAGGEVRAVDAAARTISLAGRQGRGTPADRVYTLAADVQVTVDNNPVSLAEIKPGTRVLLKLAVDRKTVVRIAAGRNEPRERK